jgi:hypothetical protein
MLVAETLVETLDVDDGIAVRFSVQTTPTLAAVAAALPPKGAEFATWGGPASRLTTPTLAAVAAALPPKGAEFATWGGPASLIAGAR